MAEILVKMVDAIHNDPIRDMRGCYKRGDPVLVMPDGHLWGREELKPLDQGGKFVVVKVPGIDFALIKQRLETPERSDLVRDPETGEGVVTRRRQFTFDLTSLAAGTVRTMERDGTVTFTTTAARNQLVNKRTRARAW